MSSSSTQEGCCSTCIRRQAPDPAWHQQAHAVAVPRFRVASRAGLLLWDKRLTELGVGHSSSRQAHLGWALDVIDPSGLRIQLHIWEAISADHT